MERRTWGEKVLPEISESAFNAPHSWRHDPAKRWTGHQGRVPRRDPKYAQNILYANKNFPKNKLSDTLKGKDNVQSVGKLHTVFLLCLTSQRPWVFRNECPKSYLKHSTCWGLPEELISILLAPNRGSQPSVIREAAVCLRDPREKRGAHLWHLGRKSQAQGWRRIWRSQGLEPDTLRAHRLSVFKRNARTRESTGIHAFLGVLGAPWAFTVG